MPKDQLIISFPAGLRIGTKIPLRHCAGFFTSGYCSQLPITDAMSTLRSEFSIKCGLQITDIIKSVPHNATLYKLGESIKSF